MSIEPDLSDPQKCPGERAMKGYLGVVAVLERRISELDSRARTGEQLVDDRAFGASSSSC